MKSCLACNRTFTAEGWTCPQCGYAPSSRKGFLCFAPELEESNSEYDPKHFSLLAKFEDGSFWFQTRNELIGWAMTRFFSTAQDILEVGVGTGFVLRSLHKILPRARLCGSDIHTEGLRFTAARLGGQADLMQLDAKAMPFRDHFDVACAFDVLEHIREDEVVLDQMRLCLHKEGGIMLTVPQHMFLWGPADEAAFHQRRYRINELAEKVKAAGFEVLFKTSFVSFLLPAMYLSRLRSRQSGQYDLEDELRIQPTLNRLFRSISALETGLIRAGIRMPVGGSQLLVAVRRR
jgi:SAM-dependent methyltransferase